MDAAGLLVFEPVGDISGHSEVGVLVDALGDEAVDLFVGAEDLRKCVAERRDRLDRWEGHSSAVMASSESEDSLAYSKELKKWKKSKILKFFKK